MKIHVLNTGFFKLDGGAMFGVVPKSIWSKLNPPDDNNLCTWAMRCLLIEEDNRLILVDTGIGDKQDPKFFGHYYLHDIRTIDSLLSDHGFSSNDVTDVFLTHLHFDHCGGAVARIGEKLIPAFANATYWCNQRHWDWATKPNDREKASFLPENIFPLLESGKLKFIDEVQGINFTTSITIRFAYGHTDAMMLPLINFKGRTLAYVADLLPSVSHIPLPYVMAYDMFPLVTLKEKKAFLKEAVEKNYLLFFEHDPMIECCELIESEKGIRAGKTLRLSEI